MGDESDTYTTVTEHDGTSDMVTFEVVGKPDPAVLFQQIGSDPDIRYRYEWDERGDPTPEQFERLGSLEVMLVVMASDFDGELREAADDAHDALVDLKEAMMDARDLDDDQRKKVAMGNVDGLPEVTKP